LKGPKGPAKFLAGYDAGREADLIGLLAKNRTWQCPTLLWEYGGWLVDVVDVTKYPELRYAPAVWREKTWPRFKADMVKSYATDPLPVREKWVEHELGIIARLHRAGVPLLAGTDAPPGVGIVPGMSLHRELGRFVAAGLSPLEALQTATINPARFLEKTGELGSIEAGQTADLVLLDANRRHCEHRIGPSSRTGGSSRARTSTAPRGRQARARTQRLGAGQLAGEPAVEGRFLLPSPSKRRYGCCRFGADTCARPRQAGAAQSGERS
jgi:hypothetical protein